MSKNKEKQKPETKIQNKVTPVVDETNDDSSLTINLQPYLVPLSIIIGSIIISLSIILSIKGQNLFSGNNNVLGTTNVTTTPVDTTVQNPAAKTNIVDAPFIGNKETAKVAIVEFSDFECPYCKRHHEQVYPDVIKNLVTTGKAIYAYRTYIAVPAHNPAATTEAYAANCFRELTNNDYTKFFDFSEQVYSNTQANGAGLVGNKLYDIATSFGVNSDQLKSCIDSGKYKDRITSEQTLAEAAGIQGTPGFVVGKLSADGTVDGKLIPGAYPYSEFERIVTEMSQ